MATVSELRTGVATNLATISGLRTAATMPDLPNPPIALVTPISIEYDKAFGQGMTIYTMTVTVIVGRVSERTAQNTLDAYCSSTGASSIKKAIESDVTLGGKAFDCRVSQMRNYGSTTISENEYLAAEFDLSIYAI